MREQAKSVLAFAANPLRARLLARELERKCLDVRSPSTDKKFDRYEHINRFTTTQKSHKKRFYLPRRPFFRWRSGEALPNHTTRTLIDKLFDERLGTKWGNRGNGGPEQTLLCALDLISRSNHVNCESTLKEAEEILRIINASLCNYIPTIPNLDRPKFTSYCGGKLLDSINSKRNIRYPAHKSGKAVAYPYISKRINPYDSVSPICAGLLYLVKPNNISKHSDELTLSLLIDVISGIIAAYILMLHKNPKEFQVGGLVVNLYRLIYKFFLQPTEEYSENTNLLNEVFYNDFPEFSTDACDIKQVFDRLSLLFQQFVNKAGLSRAEFMTVIDPVNPEQPSEIIKWWSVIN